MAGPARLPQSLRKFWPRVTGLSELPAPDVIVHDPAARRAHDLETLFLTIKCKRAWPT